MNQKLFHKRTGTDSAPLISVVLPVYNGEKYLVEAIDSVLVQSFSDFELIVIDDGSTDGSLRILQEYQKRDKRILLVSRENRNLATTLNDSIDIARGEWIVRMDQDDIALPHRFERQLQWLEQTGADICGSWVKHFGSWDRRTWRGCQSDQAIKMEMLFKSPFVHPSVMMRADLAKQLRYDKTCEKAEDYDLWVRAAQAGWKMSNVPEVLLLYRRHATQISTNSLSKQQNVGEKIQKRYWAFMKDFLDLRQESAQEVLNLIGLRVRPEMDVVDSVFSILLKQNDGEAKKTIMNNLSRLYLKAAIDHSDIATRWGRLNRQSAAGGAIGMKLKFWFVRYFKIRYGDSSSNFLEKIYNFVVR